MSKGVNDLNITINQLGLIAIAHPLMAEYEFLISHRIVTKIDHILDHKIHFKKFKRIEIIQRMFSYRKGKYNVISQSISFSFWIILIY